MKSTKIDGRQPVKNTEPTLAEEATTDQDVAETAVQVRLLLVLHLLLFMELSSIQLFLLSIYLSILILSVCLSK